MRSLGTLIAVAVVAAVAATAPAHAAAPPDFIGIVADDTFATDDPGYRNREFTEMQALGITAIRKTFEWHHIERARGQYDWAYYDAWVMAASQHGIRVLPILFGPPSFRSSRPRRGAKRGTYFPKKLSDLGHFGVAVAKRYGPNGSLWTQYPEAQKVPITSYQIWNEPNLPVYDPPKPNPKHYTKLLKASAKVIKAAEPSAEILTAGLPNSKLSRPGNVFKYIDGMYRAGAKSAFDTLAINPYGSSSKAVIKNVNKARGIMRRRGDSSGKLWVTEIGWSDKGPRGPQRVGPTGQASRITQTIAGLHKRRGSLNLRGIFYYSWMDGRPYDKSVGDFWGLHTGLKWINGRHKPAYDAFKQAVAKL